MRVGVRVRVCVRARSYVGVSTILARGRMELMMTAATFMRDVLHKEAVL